MEPFGQIFLPLLAPKSSHAFLLRTARTLVVRMSLLRVLFFCTTFFSNNVIIFRGRRQGPPLHGHCPNSNGGGFQRSRTVSPKKRHPPTSQHSISFPNFVFTIINFKSEGHELCPERNLSGHYHACGVRWQHAKAWSIDLSILFLNYPSFRMFSFNFVGAKNHNKHHCHMNGTSISYPCARINRCCTKLNSETHT